MKTIKIKLLTTSIIVSAVIIATTIPANAQRRTSQNTRTETRTEKNDRNKNVTTEKKSDNKVGDSRQRTSNNVGSSSNRDVKTKSGTINNSSAQRSTSSNRDRSVSESRTSQPQNKSGYKTPSGNSSRSNSNVQGDRSRNSSAGRTTTAPQSRNDTRNRPNYGKNVPNERRTTGPNNVRPEARNNPSRAREIYRHDEHDSRYTPNSNYRGSNRYWANTYRPGNMNYNRNDRDFYRRYDFRTYNHWDRSWENYRWNLGSWRDYYGGYNPYSYRYYKFYYHHPVYGHVIKRFDFRPMVFIHNHNRYYCYDGHFFRYRRGIGYILVDIPFGIMFDQMPVGYDRVYINGYLYFRVGNLFFEFTNLGYRLVHYPERYFSYNDGYMNEGYYFDDDVY